jgi:hypothetical protein
MPKIFDPFKLSSTVRPLYWAQRQRRASTELVVSTVCTMTSSGQAAHGISQKLTKHFSFFIRPRFNVRHPQLVKPFAPGQLVSAVSNLLNAHP